MIHTLKEGACCCGNLRTGISKVTHDVQYQGDLSGRGQEVSESRCGAVLTDPAA